MSDSQHKNELPKDWKWVKLAEIADKISLNKIKIKQKDYLSEGAYPVVDQGQDLIGGFYNDKNLVIPHKPPFIIFGDHTRVKKYINFNFIAGADGVKVLKAKEIADSKFLYYSLFTIKIEDKGYARHFQLLEKEYFPLPPLTTQQAIVAKIEELFSELDKGIENLRTAQQQLKTYRQSVLKWAFEGKLTNENVQEGELPKGWKWLKLETIATKITDGEHITPKRVPTGVLLLSARNVQNGYLDLTNVDYVPEEEYLRISKRCNPEYGDILISCSGSVGRVSRVPANLKFSMVRSVALVKLNSAKSSSKFFEYLFQSPILQKQIEKGKKATAQANLFLGPIKNLLVIECTLEEQYQIVQAVESRLSVADKMDESITQSLQQSEALRQSILKKAFEGRLVKK